MDMLNERTQTPSHTILCLIFKDKIEASYFIWCPSFYESLLKANCFRAVPICPHILVPSPVAVNYSAQQIRGVFLMLADHQIRHQATREVVL